MPRQSAIKRIPTERAVTAVASGAWEKLSQANEKNKKTAMEAQALNRMLLIANERLLDKNEEFRTRIKELEDRCYDQMERLVIAQAKLEEVEERVSVGVHP